MICNKTKEQIQTLIDKRLLIESGWWEILSFIPEVASQSQKDDMRYAYYAGVAQLWYVMHNIVGGSGGTDVLPSDIEVIQSLHDELTTRMSKISLEMKEKIKAQDFPQ